MKFKVIFCLFAIYFAATLGAPSEDSTTEKSPIICDIKCADGYALDISTGKCLCVPVEGCRVQICFNPDYIWDMETCSCILDPNLSVPSVPIESSSACWMAESSCPEHSYFDNARCECIPLLCAIDCPPGYINYGCACVPPPSSEPSIDICDPNLIKCPDGLILDEILCECVENLDPSCPDGRYWDAASCSCICSNYTDCRLNFVWDENFCDCICPKGEYCFPGMYFDEKTCSCKCDHYKECETGFFFNQDTCSCSCEQVQDCQKGLVWDENICECVKAPPKPVCDIPGFVWDELQCRCVCEKIIDCKWNMIFDENICECICPKNIDCNGGFLNPDTCQCVYKV